MVMQPVRRSLVFVLMTVVSSVSFSLPSVHSIAEGDASIHLNGQTLSIYQASDLLHVKFNHLNIAQDETVHFSQPNVQSLAIAESLSQDPTQIYGRLSANGQMMVVSPSGLVVHEGGTVEAHALGVSTSAVLLDGQTYGEGSGSLLNYGSVQSHRTLLMGDTIRNFGSVKGIDSLDVLLGDQAVLLTGENGFAVSMLSSDLGGVLENYGLLESGGSVVLDAQQEAVLYQTAIHNVGSIKANLVEEVDGEIWLVGGDGDVELLGDIEAGSVIVKGNRIHHAGLIQSTSVINGNGGHVELLANEVVAATEGSVIDASGSLYGDGGFVKVFSPGTALFNSGAYIFAEGGEVAGDGGFVDVSGWEHIEIFGRVSTVAVNGKNGLFLIDPYNVTISAGATSNEGFGANVYTPSSSGAVINVTELQNNLKLGDVQVVTTGAGAESGDISVAVAIDLDGTNGNTLELTAVGSIQLNGSIEDSVVGTADATNIILDAGGNIVMTDGTKVNTGGGVMTLKAGGNVTLSNAITGGGSLFLTAGGNVVDGGDGGTSYDVYTAGGTAFFSVGGSIGGASWATAIEVVDTHFDFDFGGTNQTVYIDAGLSTAELEIVGLDYDTASGLDFNMRSTNGADIRVSGRMEDSNGAGDSASFNLISQTLNGDIIIEDAATIRSEGGSIDLTAGNSITLAEVWSAGGDITITTGDLIDGGDTGGSDLNPGGGLATLNLSGDIGSDFSTAIELNHGTFDINNSGSNQTHYFRAISPQDIYIRDVDYDGVGLYSFNFNRFSSGDVIFSGSFNDSNTGTAADSANISVTSNSSDGHLVVSPTGDVRTRGGTFGLTTLDALANVVFNDGANLQTNGGDVTLNSAGDVTVTGVSTNTGDVTLVAQNVIDGGGSQTDINPVGGNLNITASGNVGGTSSAGGLEVSNAILNFTAAGVNQNLFINGQGANDFVINNVDYNGTGTFNMGVQHIGSGDLQITGSVTDSAAGSSDVAQMLFSTLTGSGNIVGVDGATIRSYGGDITYSSVGQLGIVRTKTDGGALNITATEVYDNGNTGPDIETSGGDVVFTVSGDVGVSGSGSIEIRDSVITGVVGAANALWDFRSYAATNYNSVGNIDFDGADGFSFNLHHNNGGQINVVGVVADSNEVTPDGATLSLQTFVAGDDIVMSSVSQLQSYGSNITLTSADQIGLSETLSGGGDITITAGGDVYDNRPSGNELSSSGGVITINASGDVGGASFSDAIEIYDSILDVNYLQSNVQVWLNVSKADDLLTIRDVDFDGAAGSQFNIRAQNGSDILVSGQVYDSNLAVEDSFSVQLLTTAATGDITIAEGATIRSGVSGNVDINSGNDLYFTGLLGGAVTNLSAAGDILDNGSITLDIQTDGVVNMTGGSVGVTGSDTQIDVSGGTYNLTMLGGDWDVVGSGTINLNNIEINGAIGSTLSFLTTNDLNITGVMTDSVDSGDRIHLLVGASSPGFVVFPSSGYTVLGTLEFWSGTGGLRDTLDERVNLNADGLIISGNSFINNTGNIVMDLSVGQLDITHLGANRIFEINNDRDLSLTALNGDGVALSGDSFFFNVNGDLSVPNTGIRGIENEIRITANNIVDPDADNIVTINDSTADADSELRLYIDITDASTLQINTNATVFDGSSIAGSELTLNVASAELDLSQDVDGNGLTYSGAGHLILTGAGVVRLSDSGIVTPGDLSFLVGDVLDSDSSLSIAANRLLFSLQSPSAGSYSLITSISEFDVSGVSNLSLTNDQSLSLVDVDLDGEVFSGANDVTLNVSGELVLPDAGAQVNGDLLIQAEDLRDVSGLQMSINANRLFLSLSTPAALEYGVSGNVNQVNGSVGAGLVIQSSVDMAVSDWSGAGFVFGGVTELTLESSGQLFIPSTGLSAVNEIDLKGNSITDGDFNFQNINAPSVTFVSSASNQVHSLAGAFNELDVSLLGADVGLIVNQGQDLSLVDLNGDGSSLQISDGYAYLATQGALQMSGSLSVSDASADGVATGFLLTEYVGSAAFSNLSVNINSQVDSGAGSLLGMGSNRWLVRQMGTANDANQMSFSGVNAVVSGGDVLFDITANTSLPEGFGGVSLDVGSSVAALNVPGEGTAVLPGFVGLTLDGTLLVGQNRNIAFQGYTLESDIPVIVEPDIEDQVDQSVSDAINDSVQDQVQETADDVQEETVSAVEDSPNVNFALNEMFSGCREGNERDAKCKMKEEISRFLGRFLIGGSMPKTVR